VPRPEGIYSPPWSRTEHLQMFLVSDERVMTDRQFITHAHALIDYLEKRLSYYEAIPPRPRRKRANH
jgi:hypothetical protein